MGFLSFLVNVTRALCGGPPPQEPEKPTPFPLPEQLPAPTQDQRPPQHRPQQQQQQGEWPTPGEQHEGHKKPHKQQGSGGAGGHGSSSTGPGSGGGQGQGQGQGQGRHGGKPVDLNLINQQNPQYTSIRARANEEGDAMSRCFEESHQAYEGGDGARAKELSNEGKRHKAEMERLNDEASAWIFRENNLDSQPGEIDLHGLYVKEAITYTDKSIQEARQRGDSTIHLIVGKGLHSPQHAAKLKPAIEELMQKHNLVAAIDAENAGVLIVQLDGGRPPAGGTREILGVDDITRRLDRGGGKDDGCLIM
ncbi:DUF1771-domain-containing protein [Stereum hirsutum FP-91666 SS1]|uniref:DUF1771-domain-containing protein n=1 Tax=Stereum hirsutum (strain FP-91666) TaxID=721885 RepID=UPI0004449BE8|nr:DUF1771-domain-containing protein [Stereum hirsutum FP-91666 SS1]EIM82692.1 DUF1771-domain-containing protein [Stereum hirsutum FP-91666 SS1]